MQPANSDATPGTDGRKSGFEPALQRRLQTIGSDRYASETERVVQECWQWLQRERDVDELDEVTVTDCRRWVQYGLGARVGDDEDGLAARSAHTYYDIARATFEWWVRDETLDTNPMKPERVSEELPEVGEDPDQQFWTPEARDILLRHVDKQVDRALDDDEDAPPRAKAYRDRTLCYLLADTGVRGAEICSVPQDSARNGLRWRDVDLDQGVLRVLGKTSGRTGRKPQSVGLPEPTAKKLELYKRWLEPNPNWPVLPSLDPTKQGGDGPPPLQTTGARERLKALSKAAGATVDGEYLKPHGARRLLGHEVYNEVSAESSQAVMRHQSVETTKKSYEDTRATEVGDTIERVRYGDDEKNDQMEDS